MPRRAGPAFSSANKTTANFLVTAAAGAAASKILLPKGFIQGQKLQETLRRLTLPFSNSTDFDLLPTPFRAVATIWRPAMRGDDKGDLAIAIAPACRPRRASRRRIERAAAGRRRLAQNLPVKCARNACGIFSSCPT